MASEHPPPSPSRPCTATVVRCMPIVVALAITWSMGIILVMNNPKRRAEFMFQSSREKKNPVSLKDDISQPPHAKQVYYLTKREMHINDPFSATWLQPLSKFMQLNTSNINTVEDGCFKVFHTFPKAVRMTLDWLDFSVEHMSKWWKMLDIYGTEGGIIPFHRAVTAFQAYTRSTTPYQGKSPLQATFAIVAFQTYENSHSGSRGRPLTVSSLAATVASLAKVGMGRVVVAGMTGNDESIVHETFRYLQNTLDPDGSSDSPVTSIGPMEVSFVRLSKEQVKSKFIETNIPKGALQVLQEGFKGKLDHNRTRDLFGTTTKQSHWQYIYLTEPDIILQTRPSVLPQLKQALDQGLILAPHRLQPIPHETDFIGLEDEHKFVKNTGNFSRVLNLHEDAVCCDEQAGEYRPWQDYFENCGTFWWQCGFLSSTNYSHDHLRPYSFIRLEGGTGIVNLAATEHGRRCFPSRHGVCIPKNEFSSTGQ